MNKQQTTRVAIVSDTHGQICPQVLEVAGRCDVVVHAGDVMDPQILDLLHSATGAVIAVAGNNDALLKWSADPGATAEALPETVSLELPGGRLDVEHGHHHGWAAPDHDRLRAAHPGARIVVYGHTHHRVIDDTAAPWVINPGAAGRVRNNGGPSCLVLNASLEAWDIESFRF
jgi:putative phosphoesterase